MTDLVPYQHPQPPQSRDVVDGWVGVVADVVRLAEHIARTDFVPKGLRGNAPATAAAMLTGREIGVGPMTSLAHLAVIDGRPSMSAQLMRALVLAAGHSIVTVEASRTRCRVEGRRATGEVAAVEWTIDDARDAGLLSKDNWRKYPRAMLKARATAELCRDLFPDVLGGMAYTPEEVGDLDVPAPEPVTAAAPKRVSRKAAAAPVVPSTTVVDPPLDDPQTSAPPAAAEPAVPPPASDSPSEPQADDRQTGTGAPGLPPSEVIPVGPEHVIDPRLQERAEQAAAAERTPSGPMTAAQSRHIFALLREIQPLDDVGDDREARLDVARILLSRPRLESFRQIDAREAGQLIDTLARIKASDDPAHTLAALLRESAEQDRLNGADVAGELPIDEPPLDDQPPY